MQKIATLRELLIHQLQDIHTVERQNTRLIPRMMELVQNRELQGLLERFRDESKEHVERLNESLAILQQQASTERCEAMAGLITEADNLLMQTTENGVRDTALATIAHRLQQYELAGYNTAKSLAQTLGYTKIVELFKQSIDEGNDTGRRLLELSSKKLHRKALAGV